VAVLLSMYAAARKRHAKARASAYDLARDEAVEQAVCGPYLRITDIGEDALSAWERTWGGVHPSGAGGWDWRALVENVPRRAAVLAFAIWYGGDLCGFALGQASRRRLNGSRHTITLTYVERRPEPPDVPLRGQVVALAAAVAREYGFMMGARHLRLRAPDQGLLPYYESHGFETAWKGNVPIHCEKEIRPWKRELRL
jgi:hypothetical protein